MSHRKGFTNNPNGRPQGSQNKTTKEIRSMLHAFVEKNIEGIQNDFDQLDSIERLRVFEKFLQYLLPRYASLQVVDSEVDLLQPLVIIRTVSDKEDE